MTDTTTTKVAVVVGRDPLFGAAPVITGEEAHVYDAFYARVAAAVKPGDFLEEILAVDVADTSWDVRRLRRIKANIVSAATADELPLALRQSELIYRWRAGNIDAVQTFESALVSIGTSTEAIAAQAFQRLVETIERIDLMIMRAEARRNAALREVERHRWNVARALRAASEEAIDAEYEDVEPDQLPKPDPLPQAAA
jgi:hypothetical protein